MFVGSQPLSPRWDHESMSTMTSTSERRWSTSSNHAENFKFPDFEVSPSPRSHLPVYGEEGATGRPSARTPSPNALPKSNGILHSERWQARGENHVAWSNGQGTRHSRQKSLSDAIRTIRTRKGSVSANAHEIADALKAPVSVRLVVCALLSDKGLTLDMDN